MPMSQRWGYGVGLLLVIACASPAPEQGADAPASAAPAVIPRPVDTVGMKDSAEATLAQLLSNPASAVFEEVTVHLRPLDEGKRIGAAVCGSIRGTPGLGGGSESTRFIYQSRWTVFVEDGTNQQQFGELWQSACQSSSPDSL